MSFEMLHSDLSAHELMALHGMGDVHVMYLPADEPFEDERLKMLEAGFRTWLPEGAPAIGNPEKAFRAAVWRRTNALFIDRLTTACRKTCPDVDASVINLLVTAAVECLAYEKDELYVLLDERVPHTEECDACLSRVYDAFRTVYTSLPERLKLTMVYLKPSAHTQHVRAAA